MRVRSAVSGLTVKATDGACASALGTSRLPTVGTEKLMAGVSSVTATTCGAAVFSVSLGFGSLSASMRVGGGGGGSMMVGMTSSSGGGALIRMVAGLEPTMPTSKNRMQIEL